MDKEIKAKWVKALRSGEYTQTRSYLECRGSNCCLGVLCRALLVEADATDEVGIVTFDGDRVELSTNLLNRFGLTEDQQSELISMNDGTRAFKGDPKSFADIADYIEQNL